MLGLYKKWKAKKEKELADKIRKEMMNSSPRIRVSHPEIVPVNVKVFSLDKAEGMQYVNGNPYMRDTMNEHLAKKLGRQLLESGLIDVEYEQCIDESLCIKAKVEEKLKKIEQIVNAWNNDASNSFRDMCKIKGILKE